MSSKVRFSAAQIAADIKSDALSAEEAFVFYNAKKDSFNAFVSREADFGEQKIATNASPLAGVPIAVKDNICIAGGRTTASSKILENYVSPFSATVVKKIQAAGLTILGKTNLDEFAMGGSTETSFFGTSINPWGDGKSRVPGGSSGGSAAAVAGELAPLALGSDTGGSIRQPCSFCNLTGLKPTYGTVSRYGLIAYGSSLDQIGPMAHTAEDCRLLFEIIKGHDPKDSTSLPDGNEPGPSEALNELPKDLKGFKIGLPKNYLSMQIDDAVRRVILETAEVYRSLGATVSEFELPLIDAAVPTYLIIACAEASSNLSRFDGVKYGFRAVGELKDLKDLYLQTRSEGFGTEVKRRIMLGSFVLSSGFFDAYYKKALKVRYLIKQTFENALKDFDFILSPVCPTPAYEIGGQIKDPLAMYLGDIFTTSVNLTGMPSLALPSGFSADGLPIGSQLIGPAFADKKLLRAGEVFQAATDHHLQRPPILRGAHG